jgi:Kdo2-lipid IVA lauroyltransferase/acyltransferase
VGIVGWLFYLLPRSAQLGLGRLVGRILLSRKVRLGVVEQNIDIAYPARNIEFKKKLIRESYEGLGNLLLELIILFGPFKKFIRKQSILLGAENWDKAVQAGKGAIFISSHVGNWEVMAASGAVFANINIMIVTKHLKPEWVHRAVERARARAGVLGTYEPRTLKDALRHLGKNGAVGFVMDQYSGPPVGVRVPVFGVPVGTPAAVAALAKRTGAAVLPVVSYRDDQGKFRVEIRPAMSWESGQEGPREIAVNTARFAAELEKDIYAHPEQWLWTHRRFKGDLGPLGSEEWDQGRSRK